VYFILNYNMDKNSITRLIASGYDFDVKEAFQHGWELFTIKPLLSIGYTGFIISLQLLFILYLREYSILYSVFLSGPLFSGFYFVANKLKSGEEIIYPDFFRGFQYYIPIILIWLIGQILVSIGIVLFVIPGIYLMVAYSLAILLNIFAGLDFWDSLEYSRRLVTLKWWKFFVLVLFLILMNVVGMFFLVGILITIPLSFYVAYCVFEEITKEALQEE